MTARRILRSGRGTLVVVAGMAVVAVWGLWGLSELAGSQDASSEQVAVQQLRNRAQAQFEEKLYARATEIFAEVVESPEATAQDYLNLALARFRDRDHAGALEALREAGARDDSHAGVPFLTGLISKRAGQFEVARAELERAQQLDPNDPAINYNLGAVYTQLGDTDAALVEFDQVTALGFDIALQHYVSSLYQHFQILLRRGERDAAEPEIADYRTSIRRLSQAARAPIALEESIHAVIRVPSLSLIPSAAADAGSLSMQERPAIEALPGSPFHLMVSDFNADERPDVVATALEGRVWLSSPAGLEPQALVAPAGPAGAGDFDRDGWPDLYISNPQGDTLLRNRLGDLEPEEVPSATPATITPLFEEVETEGLPDGGSPTSVLWVDFDHDGDLDVLVTHDDPDSAPISDRLIRNQGGGVFLDVTEAAGVGSPRRSLGALWGDFDVDHDVDLYVWGGDSNSLYTNLRTGRFADIAAAAGAAGPGGTRAAVAEDFDNDGYLDIVLAAPDGFTVLRNSGQGTFLPVQADGLSGLSGGASADIEVADWNNDSYLDLVLSTTDGLRFLANDGSFRFLPFDPGPFAAPSAARAEGERVGAEPRPLIFAADANGDGGVDLLLERPDRLSWVMQEGPAAAWLSLRLTGVKNNLRGVGSTIEVKAGGAYQMRPFRRFPLHFGVADAASLDVVRIRWPNGIVQNLLNEPVDRLVMTTELERLEGSCPFLYVWNGSEWEFINEVLGIAPLGMPLAEGVIHTPDPDEYVPVPGEVLRRRGGEFEIRLTEELREAGYLDAARLLAVDYQENLRVLPDERFSAPPHPQFRLFLVDDQRGVGAVDQDGRDWSAELATVDGEWAVPFVPGPYDGMATPHSLTLDLARSWPSGEEHSADGSGKDPVRLYLTGWVYWATGSINLAADQDPRHAFTPVSIEVPDGSGGWRVAIEDIGLPNAKNSTMVVDLTEHLLRGDPRIRVRTTMRLYWDAVTYSVGGLFPQPLSPQGSWQEKHGVPRAGRMILGDGSAPVRVSVLAPVGADLRPRGFSQLHRSIDGYETFDYQSVLQTAPWDQHPGTYTRFGAVDDLVGDADDRYVIFGTGDELSIRFAGELPAVPPGWRRDYLIYLNGWVKDGDINTLHGDQVEPLPFHGMSTYPYAASESYPDDAEHQAFLDMYITRPARLINTPLRPDR